LKVTTPSGSPVGTISFITGLGADTPFYDTYYTFGAKVINGVVNAGYTAVQITFNDPYTGEAGWMTGPGGTRALAGRYATTLQWIYDNIHLAGTTLPYCATGQSGGAGALGYALSRFGMGSILDLAEPTGGPPISRIDHGCICTQPAQLKTCGIQTKVVECFDAQTAQGQIDPSFDGDVDPLGSPDPDDICTVAQHTRSTLNQSLFLENSIIGTSDAILQFPNTDVHVILGGQDDSAAYPQAMDWTSVVTALNGNTVTPTCMAQDGHKIPNYVDGSTKIIMDLTTYCVPHHQTQ
jgi:hypothetical protein